MDQGVNMEEYIFSMRENKKPENKKSSVAFYTIYGEHDFIDEQGNPRIKSDSNPGLLARKIGNQFYIRVGLYGKIFNPIGMYSEGQQNKFLTKVGKEAYSFSKVNQKVFDMYLNFLRTKNLAWLHNAEREMI